ncbi:MAG TPA: Holliday junction branch migration protein RuvA, partial [Candidatus Acetothermia bacterium]|nr:Holliday junction branch migration protein RuvA [Candidatus Acetothermia bacterium]
LQILSSMPVETLIEAIRTNDVSRLTSIKGIGEKTAQRILIDLRDKLSTGSLEALRAVLLSPAEETVLQALTSKSLGFSAREARQAILELRGRRLDSQELLREALALIGRGR